MKNKLFIFLIISIILCIPAHAEDKLSVNEVMNIILDYHDIETDIDVSEYLTLSAVDMTREAAITAVIRSYGIYPANEPDYLWVDEAEQIEAYRPYIDYAHRMGITDGVGGNRFAPARPVTAWELRTMLDRANGIQPKYPLTYDSPICRLLSAETQRGLSLVPDFLVDKFYQEGRVIHATGTLIILPNGSCLSDLYAGWIQYEGDMWLSVECDGEPYSHQDRTVIHEIGHYLGHRTVLIDRNTVPKERDWLSHRYRKYCNENNHEFFADSFVAYILWPEEMAFNAPTVYKHIETCLHKMKSDLEDHQR